MRHLLAIVAGLALLLGAPAARAGDLRILTIDGTPWARMIEQIQDDVGSDGHVYRIVVRDGQSRFGCDDYQLSFDAVAATAFRVESCEKDSGATLLRLVHREALFQEGDIVPRARPASIHATIVRHGSADGGGAPPRAGSKLWCSVALQPYLWDGLRGQAVPLMPDRFALRPVETHIQAAPDGAGCIARGESRFALRFHYEVVDLRTGSKVLDNEASLVCADTPVGPPPAPEPAVACAEAPAAKNLEEPPPDLHERRPLRWSASLDIPVPWTATFVGTLLVRSLGDVVFPDGTRASRLYGGQPVGVWGGSTLGFTYQRGGLVIPTRLTFAGDAHVLAISGFTGAGLSVSTSADTSLLAAPVLRFTTLHNFDAGSFNRFEPAALLGIRHRLWGPWFARCHGGFLLFAEAAVPLAAVGAWYASAGVTQTWGPDGGYFFSGCPATPSKRRR